MRSSENSRPTKPRAPELQTTEPHTDICPAAPPSAAEVRPDGAIAEIRPLAESEIGISLFSSFTRRQEVKKCLRSVGGQWVETEAPFIDDWNAEDYKFLAQCLRRTVQLGGIVFGAFVGGALKGFASVESAPLGKDGGYRDLTSIHVSAEMRGRGIGRELFSLAKSWAKEQGAKKLYISSHSAVESQAFYAAMGCTDAREIHAEHAEREPFDRQLECDL